MFWIAVLAALAALSLIKLGALSVWVQVLGTALACAAAVIVAGFMALLARSLVRRFRRT